MRVAGAARSLVLKIGSARAIFFTFYYLLLSLLFFVSVFLIYALYKKRVQGSTKIIAKKMENGKKITFRSLTGCFIHTESVGIPVCSLI